MPERLFSPVPCSQERERRQTMLDAFTRRRVGLPATRASRIIAAVLAALTILSTAPVMTPVDATEFPPEAIIEGNTIGLDYSKKTPMSLFAGQNDRGQAGTGSGGVMTNYSAVDYQAMVPADEKIIKRVHYNLVSFVITDKGSVYSWGTDRNGLTGFGASNSASLLPQKIRFGSTYAATSRVVDIVVSTRAAYALTENGSVVAWGTATHGALGTGATSGVHTPANVTTNVDAIFPVTTGAWFRMKSGELLGVGNSRYSLLDRFDTEGVPVARPSALRQALPFSASQLAETRVTGRQFDNILDFKSFGAVARLTDGSVYTWGIDSRGDGFLGHGYGVESKIIPTQIPGLADVVEVVSNDYRGSVAVLTASGKVFGWGNDDYLTLGVGGRGNMWSPFPVNDVPPIQRLDMGWTSVIAVAEDGSLWGWGISKDSNFGSSVPAGRLKFPVEVSRDIPPLDRSVVTDVHAAASDTRLDVVVNGTAADRPTRPTLPRAQDDVAEAEDASSMPLTFTESRYENVIDDALAVTGTAQPGADVTLHTEKVCTGTSDTAPAESKDPEEQACEQTGTDELAVVTADDDGRWSLTLPQGVAVDVIRLTATLGDDTADALVEQVNDSVDVRVSAKQSADGYDLTLRGDADLEGVRLRVGDLPVEITEGDDGGWRAVISANDAPVCVQVTVDGQVRVLWVVGAELAAGMP
ncbi:RCC1 domain-containing protein [Microbacterium sp. NPDC089695]|uniref:RCC1 domain-containing protein n=1 Tax=Microbacterium sp. NPDC089695 TaxID=3364198 RepID=UPI003801AFAA